jgi:hypothetical protein
LEARQRAQGIVGLPIRVQYPRQVAVSPPDLIDGRITRDSEFLVVVHLKWNYTATFGSFASFWRKMCRGRVEMSPLAIFRKFPVSLDRENGVLLAAGPVRAARPLSRLWKKAKKKLACARGSD